MCYRFESSPLWRVDSLLVVKHRPGKGGLYSPWSYRPGEGLARPNGWNGAVRQEDGVILPWVDLRTQKLLVSARPWKRETSRVSQTIERWPFGGCFASLSMDAECFCRTRLGSTGREGHLEEYTLLCDQTNEELNLHRLGDVALSKEWMFTYQREEYCWGRGSPQAAARDNRKD